MADLLLVLSLDLVNSKLISLSVSENNSFFGVTPSSFFGTGVFLISLLTMLSVKFFTASSIVADVLILLSLRDYLNSWRYCV